MNVKGAVITGCPGWIDSPIYALDANLCFGIFLKGEVKMSLATIRVKSNHRFTCQECGSTELIQGHHEIPGDDTTIISLCAKCHSRKHPNVPKALFFNSRQQPYWHNKSASSLAKECGLHPRTIWRVAKRLGIPMGSLKPLDELLIKNNTIGRRIWMQRKQKGNTLKIHNVFTWNTWQRLLDFVTANYGGKRGLSITVERAVREFLDRQGA